MTAEGKISIYNSDFMRKKRAKIIELFANERVLECAKRFGNDHALVPITADEKTLRDAGAAMFVRMFQQNGVASALCGYTMNITCSHIEIMQNLIRMEICNWLAMSGNRSVESWARDGVNASMAVDLVRFKMIPREFQGLAYKSASEKYQKKKTAFEQASDPMAYIALEFPPYEAVQTMSKWRSELHSVHETGVIVPPFEFLRGFVLGRSEDLPWTSPEAWVRSELAVADSDRGARNAEIAKELRELIEKYSA